MKSLLPSDQGDIFECQVLWDKKRFSLLLQRTKKNRTFYNQVLAFLLEKKQQLNKLINLINYQNTCLLFLFILTNEIKQRQTNKPKGV